MQLASAVVMLVVVVVVVGSIVVVVVVVVVGLVVLEHTLPSQIFEQQSPLAAQVLPFGEHVGPDDGHVYEGVAAG